MFPLPPLALRQPNRLAPVAPLSIHDRKTAEVRRFVAAALAQHTPGMKLGALEVTLHSSAWLRATGDEQYTVKATVDGKPLEAEGSVEFGADGRLKSAELIIGRGWVDRVERDATGAWKIARGLNYRFIDA